MSKKLLNILLAIVAMIGFTACGGSSDDGGDDVPADTKGTITMYTNNVTLESNAAATQQIDFVASAAWTATSSESWCTINPTSGSTYIKQMTATISENTSTDARTATIKIQLANDASKSQSITITQPGKKEIVAPTGSLVQGATAEVKAVFAYMQSIYGKKTMSATMANVNWNINEAELVYKATGKYPAIATFDYIHLPYSPANWIDYSNTTVAENWWNAGGIISAGWHWLVPASETDTNISNYTYEPTKTTFRAKNIFVEGSWEKKTADADLEKMANMLLLLQDKGIPVIWRPLHEAAGNTYEYTGGTAWFWWGYDGAETYKKLWQYMFNYFAKKGLKNLIWVWTSQTKDSDFYPGDDYVDIVGRDIYNKTTASDNAEQFNTLTTSYSNKMVALSEMGNVAKISAQWDAGAKWLYFMPWYENNATTLDGHSHANTAWWKDAMSSDYVVTRDQLPSFK